MLSPVLCDVESRTHSINRVNMLVNVCGCVYVYREVQLFKATIILDGFFIIYFVYIYSCKFAFTQKWKPGRTIVVYFRKHKTCKMLRDPEVIGGVCPYFL